MRPSFDMVSLQEETAVLNVTVEKEYHVYL